MKSWSVTFRNKNGKQETIKVSASDRPTVFKECQKLGIKTVIRISETESKKANRFLIFNSPIVKWGMFIIFLIVSVWACLFLFSNNKLDQKETSKQRKAIKGSQQIRKKKIDKPAPKQPAPVDEKTEVQAPDTNIVWISKRRYIAKMKNGKTKTVIIDDPDEIKEPPIFKSGVNNFLTNYMIPGEPVPPTPISFSNEEVLQALMENVEITDEDSENVRYAKESILVMRDELKETIKNGGTLSDYISDLQRRQDLEAAVVQESRQMIMQELRNESPAKAKELYDNINKYLNEKGLPAVRIPRKFLKLMNEGVQ